MIGQLAELSPEVRRNLKFDLLAGSLTGLLTGAVNAFILVQARRIGATPFQVSLLAAVPFFWMLFSPFWAALLNRKSPFRIVLLCDGVARILLILLLLNSTPGWYLFLFALHYLLGSISATIYFKTGYQTSIRILRDDSRFRQYVIALFLYGLANLMSVPVYALFQVDTLKVNDGFISILVLVTFGTSLICYLVGGRFIDRDTPLRLSILVFALGPLVPLFYFLAGPPWLLLIAGAVQGVMNAGIDLASLNNVIHFADTRTGGGEVNSYMGVHMNLLGIRGTLGPLLAPLLVQLLTIRGVFVSLFLLFLVGLGAGLRVER